MTNFTVAVAPWTPMLVHLLPLISNPSMVSTAYTTYINVRFNPFQLMPCFPPQKEQFIACRQALDENNSIIVVLLP
jgi:hypothetical protein